MPVGSIIELYTTILAWTIYDSLFAILSSCGIMLIPFIIMMINIMLNVREKLSDTATSKGMVNALETRVFIGVFVVLLAFYPAITVYPAKTSYNSSRCGVDANGNLKSIFSSKAFGDSDTTLDNTKGYFNAMVGDKGPPQAPFWWYVWTLISQAITQAAKQELPCQADLRTMAAGLAHLNVADKKLQSELKDFYHDCWQPAVNKFNREHPVVPAWYGDKINDDIAWAGSKFFIDTPGYYDTKRTQQGLDSANFPYQESRDSQILPADANDGSGWPSCAEWWASNDAGLRTRVLSDLKAGAGNANCEDCAGAWFKYWAANWFQTQTDADNALIKTSLVSDNHDYQMGMNNAVNLPDHSLAQATENLAAGIGLLFKSAVNATETEAYRQAAPIVQAIILLIFISVLPILMVVSLYELVNLMALTLVLFTLVFWGYLFTLAGWIDNYLVSGVLSSNDAEHNLLDMVMPEATNSMATMILTWVARATYIGIPLVFASFMGVIAYSLSGLVGAKQGMIAPSASAASSGAGMIQGVVTKGIKGKLK